MRAFGYDAEELLGQPVEILVPTGNVPGHLQLREAYVEHALPRAMGSNLHLSARRKDGSTFPVEISLTPLPTDEGPWVLTGVVDISARRAAEDRVRALSRAHLALAELNAAILRSHDPTELFTEACRVVSDGSGEYVSVWIGCRDADGAFAPVAAAGEVGPVSGADILADLPALASVVDESARWLCDDVVAQTSGRWRDWALANGVVAAISLPIRRDGRSVAAFTAQSTRIAVLDEEYVAILVTMADNLSFALDRFESQSRLERSNAQRVDLLSRLVTAQEEERARIAGDIHDHSIQSLAALDLRLGLLRARLDTAAPGLSGSVDEVHAGLAQVMVDLRHLLFDLEVADPDVSLLDQLQDALDHVFVDLPVRTTLRVTGSAPEAPIDLPPDLRVQAVRICKEALTNVRRHAQAKSVTVEVHAAQDGMEIAVVDDGVGPPTDAATLRSPHGHHGVDGMRGRAEASGGWFRIVRVGGLTTVRFRLPYDLSVVDES